MAGKIDQEYKLFMKDIEKKFNNKEDIEYLKQRMAKFVNVVLEDLGKTYEKIEKKEIEIKNLEKRQEKVEEKIGNMEKVLENIENDIYAEEGFDFEIVCPYCNNSFIIDVNEDKKEVKCPECQNIIELDWTGNIEDDENNDECDGECTHCSGCSDDEDDDM